MTTTQQAHTNTATFEIGQRYTCSSPCDSGCVWTYEVTGRTAKFVTLKDVSHGDDGETVRVKVRPMGITPGVECCSPHGTYSMAALLCADDRIEEPATTVHHAPTHTEYVCNKCGETVVGVDSPDDEHFEREDGTECGGSLTLAGTWVPVVDAPVETVADFDSIAELLATIVDRDATIESENVRVVSLGDDRTARIWSEWINPAEGVTISVMHRYTVVYVINIDGNTPVDVARKIIATVA